MTQSARKREEKTRKKRVPFLIAAIFGLHLLMLLLLFWLGGRAPNELTEASYVRLEEESGSEISLELQKPPERMFYRFVRMPVGEDEEMLVPIAEPLWDGYETLVALDTKNLSPMDGYRLTMDFEINEKKKYPSPPKVPYSEAQLVVLNLAPRLASYYSP